MTHELCKNNISIGIETVILSIVFENKIHDEKCSFLPFSTRVKRSIWNQHILFNFHVA